MATATLRPTGTVASGYWEAPAEGLLHAVTSDESDSTYMFNDSGPGGTARLSFGSAAALSAVISNVQLNVRAKNTSFNYFTVGLYSGDTSINVGTGTSSLTTASHDYATNPEGGVWTKQRIEDLVVYVASLPASGPGIECADIWVVVTFVDAPVVGLAVGF